MSVLIKDMEMPTECSECEFDESFCTLWLDPKRELGTRHEKCPLSDGGQLEDVLLSVVWYNGLHREVASWKDRPLEHGFILCPLSYKEYKDAGDVETFGQLQVLWMICVSMFGDYGTSPRTGWIERVDEFKDFISRVTDWCFEAERNW